MAWFGRKRGESDADAGDPPAAGSATQLAQREPLQLGDALDDDRPARPLIEPIGETERERIASALTELESEGVDVDDLASLSAGFDAAYAAWARARAGAHERVVERYAMGIGEHLARHTDLSWEIVTDVFGTDLAVAGGLRGDFVVVPSNLVAGRWMRGETGWIPGVVGHLVRRRSQ